MEPFMNRLYIIHIMVIHSQGWKEGSSISVHQYTIYLLGIQ